MASVSNNGIVKRYSAEAAISGARIVKVGAADGNALTAAAVSDKIMGISVEDVDAASGESVDVVHDGIAALKLGGTVARGDLITTDASGQGVTAAPAAGTNNRIVGVALLSGASGDIVPVMISLGMMQG